jgi:hypothetical protein
VLEALSQKLNNKMKTYSIISLALISMLFSNCSDSRCKNGEGKQVTKTLNLNSFSGIDMQIAADIVIRQGQTQKVEVRSQENVLNELKTNISGGNWVIDFGSKCFKDYDMSIIITVPNLKEIVLSGSGDINIGDFVDQDNMDINVSGSGNIEFNKFDGLKNITCNISGSGEIVFKEPINSVDKSKIKISGSGTFDAYPVVTKNCDINISGSGDCFVHVTDELDVNISGSGNVFYKGDPKIKENISGSGVVKSRN